ncbi:hypothetical protein TNCV_971741 [Trichonephila clavipes]|nr:hypothetical protein TNCV_971741 [Trichonephila clavipes]
MARTRNSQTKFIRVCYSPIVLVKNEKTYNKKRKKASEYQVGDLVAVQCTQFGGGLKLRPKFFRPYQITEVKPRNRDIQLRKGENDCDAERERRERRDSGFTGEKPRFSFNVEANRLSDN